MIKFYLSTVLIYFTIYMASGILMRKQFIEARDKLRKAMNDNSKIYGYARTVIDYLLLSLIPLLRLLFLIGKFYFVFNTDAFIEKISERQKPNYYTEGLEGTLKEYQQTMDKYANQQKEFIKFLEDNWKDTQDIWYIKILNKYKEIIGEKNDN